MNDWMNYIKQDFYVKCRLNGLGDLIKNTSKGEITKKGFCFVFMWYKLKPAKVLRTDFHIL